MAMKSNYIVRGGYDASKITKGLASTKKQLNAFQSGVSKAMKGVAIALGAVTVGKLIKDSTKMAMGVESATDNISRNMGKASADFDKWVKTQSKGYGIAKADAHQYGSTFSNLLGSFQKDASETANSTQELMKASAIISSKTGRTYEDTADRIRSGMLGSTEAIEDLGIYTNISMIESTEAFKKFANGKSWAQLDFQVQQQIRLAAILEQTYARYGNELANTTQSKQAMFLASLKNIKLNLGQAFLPVYNVVLPALTTLGNIIENITGKISALSQTFFGKSISVQTTAVQGSTEAISDYGDATEKAGKQAKKALAGIDEITTLSQSSTSGGGAGNTSESGGTTTSPTTTATVVETDNGFTKWLDKIKDAIDPTVKALGRFKKALKPLGELVFDNLKSLYKDVLVPIGKWILGEGLPRLLDVGTSLLKSVDWSKLSSALTNLNRAIAPFAIKVGDGLILFIESLADTVKPIVSATTTLLADALNALAKAIKAIPEDVAISIGGAIGGIVTALLLFNTAISVITTIGKISRAIGGLMSGLAAHPYVAIAAGIGAIAGAIMALNQHEFNESKVGKYIKKLKDVIGASEDLNQSIKDGMAQRKKNTSSVKAEYGAIQTLADKYFKLADNATLTNDQQLLMKVYADELVKKIPQLSKLIDKQTGAYKGTKDEIQEVIKKTQQYYLVQAAQESLIEIAKDLYKANQNLKTLEQSRSETVALLAEKQKELDQANKDSYSSSRFLTQEQKTAAIRSLALSSEVTKLKNEIKNLDKQTSDTTKKQQGLNKEWDYATEYISSYSDSATTDIKSVGTAVKGVDKEFKKSDIAGNSKKMIKDFKAPFDADKTAQKSINDWLGNITKTVNGYKMPKVVIGAEYKIPSIDPIGKVNSDGWAVKGYATGGFPSAGELFVGNENGIEMMGKMGNRNVVANNNQITEGIKQAVIEAMLISSGNQKDTGATQLNLIVDSEVLATAVDKGRASNSRRTNPTLSFI